MAFWRTACHDAMLVWILLILALRMSLTLVIHSVPPSSMIVISMVFTLSQCFTLSCARVIL